MKNYENKIHSNLIIDCLDENELSTVVGGGDVTSFSDGLWRGFIYFPVVFCGMFTGKVDNQDEYYRSTKPNHSRWIGTFMGMTFFAAIVDAAIYGVYKGCVWFNNKLKRKPEDATKHTNSV